MRGRSSRPVEEADVDLTPMLDVVFILLIFFIVTAVFTKEQAIGLEPPPPPPPPNVIPPESPTILIHINADGLIRVNSRVADISSVGANIERLKAESPESAVVIQADPRAKTGIILNIRDQAEQANIGKVNLVLSAS